MKKALVLGGGGTKGAYQAGCIKALNELDIQFDIITGTSIGALHTLLYIMKESSLLDSLWHTITIEDVIKGPIDLPDSLDDIFSDIGEITTFIKQYIYNKGLDIEPLIQLISNLFDAKKVAQSPYDYGFITMKYPQLEAVAITNKQMDPQQTMEYAIASASCFPIFPIHYIQEQGYIDGGYYDNLPIELAIELGATQIIAIPLSKKSLHPQYMNRPNITHIMPRKKLGDLLDFNRQTIDLQYSLGYNDTCKAFNKYIGFYYTFKQLNQEEFGFYQNILAFENDYCKQYKTTSLPLTSYLMEHCNYDSMTINDYSVITIEMIMSSFNMEVTSIYDYAILKQKFYKEFISKYNKTTSIDIEHTSINYYYYLIKTNNTKLLYKDCQNNQQAIIIALYYFTI